MDEGVSVPSHQPLFGAMTSRRFCKDKKGNEGIEITFVRAGKLRVRNAFGKWLPLFTNLCCVVKFKKMERTVKIDSMIFVKIRLETYHLRFLKFSREIGNF